MTVTMDQGAVMARVRDVVNDVKATTIKKKEKGNKYLMHKEIFIN